MSKLEITPTSISTNFQTRPKGEPLNPLIRGAEADGIILAEENEYHFYRHPNFRRDFVRIRESSAQFPWEKALLATAPMYIRTRLRLSERVKHEWAIWAVRVSEKSELAEAARVRLKSDEPASNKEKIAKLIGAAQVEAVFDPFLDNRGLAALKDILSLGTGGIAPGARMLTSKKVVPSQRPPRLTRSYFADWSAELHISAEIKLSAQDEHRRFLLLSGGRTLIVGASLNSLSKNEAAHIENDDGEDRKFFDGQWAVATPI